jgi:hypothetical protein
MELKALNNWASQDTNGKIGGKINFHKVMYDKSAKACGAPSCN